MRSLAERVAQAADKNRAVQEQQRRDDAQELQRQRRTRLSREIIALTRTLIPKTQSFEIIYFDCRGYGSYANNLARTFSIEPRDMRGLQLRMEGDAGSYVDWQFELVHPLNQGADELTAFRAYSHDIYAIRDGENDPTLGNSNLQHAHYPESAHSPINHGDDAYFDILKLVGVIDPAIPQRLGEA